MIMKSTIFQPPPGQETEHLSVSQKFPFMCLLEVTIVPFLWSEDNRYHNKFLKSLRNQDQDFNLLERGLEPRPRRETWKTNQETETKMQPCK